MSKRLFNGIRNEPVSRASDATMPYRAWSRPSAARLSVSPKGMVAAGPPDGFVPEFNGHRNEPVSRASDALMPYRAWSRPSAARLSVSPKGMVAAGPPDGFVPEPG